MTAMFEVGTAAELRAFHLMPGVAGPEGQLHAHDYRVEVVVGRGELDDRGMVCDIDVLAVALRDLAERIDGENLEVIRPQDAEAVTVEVFARWIHQTLTPAVRAAGGDQLSVRVWESPTAFGGYRGAVT